MSDLSNSPTLTSIAQQLGEMLCKKNAKLTTAESCTGGGISEAITAVSGSSQWFEFGFVTYANSAKQQLLGVSKEAIDEYGAVSEQVVELMAQGAIQQSQADYAIAVSGIAGPDGGTEDKPVGTVWVCWQTPTRSWTQKLMLSGDRQAVRTAAIKNSLQQLLQHLI
ncbi:CinA family protein [Porticoccaceae bacterium]|nr:CinA family protein [Porticoccaceae bacterium]